MPVPSSDLRGEERSGGRIHGFGKSVVLVMFALIAAVAMFATGRSSNAAPSAPGPSRALWIPPGTYTSIVVTTSAQRRRWVVGLVTDDQTFPIAVAPGSTVVIPFERGWEIRPGDRARITIDGVETNVPTAVAQLLDEASMAITAWGITAGGPVAFVVK